MHYIVFLAGLAIFVGGTTAYFMDRSTPVTAAASQQQPSSSLVANTNSAIANTNATPSTRAASSGVVISRDRYGHFAVEARVDGRPVEFMVDTGASVVALRESDANRLGLRVSQRDYTARVSTANGVAMAAPVRLNAIDINGVVVRNVQALVHPDKLLKVNLLGMSYLSKVRFAYDRGRMVIER